MCGLRSRQREDEKEDEHDAGCNDEWEHKECCEETAILSKVHVVGDDADPFHEG